MAVKSRQESSGKPIVTVDDVEGGGCILQKPTRRKMDVLLNSVGVQLAVVIIVFLQVPLLGTLLLIDFKVIRVLPPEQERLPPRHQNETTPMEEMLPPGGDSPVVLAERILHTINIVILLLFLVEIILRVSARGSRIHTDGQQVFDCGVVMLTFVLYVAFTAANMRRAAYGAGLLTLLRLWRIRRIATTIAEQERRKLEKTLAIHRKAQKDSEEQLKQTSAKLVAMQQEMEILQQQLKVIHYIGKASPAISSSAYSKVSEDLVTSDEESERYTDCDSQIQTPKILDTIQAEITAAGLAGRRFYSHSITTSNSPSPATSFSHLVDEFLMNSEFKDFKDLSSLSKVAPTKVSVPDLVEHLQAADVKGKVIDAASPPTTPPSGRPEEADVTRDYVVVHHPPQQLPQQQPTQSIDSQNSDPPSEPQEEACPSAVPEAGSPELPRPRRLGEDEESNPGATPAANHPSSGTTPVVNQKQEKKRLTQDTSAKPEMREKSERGGHDNLAFEAESGLEEKDRRKASKVPLNKNYGSSTYLNEEGIPMTDL